MNSKNKNDKTATTTASPSSAEGFNSKSNSKSNDNSSLVYNVAAWATLIAAVAFTFSLSVRNLTGTDLGYHLAYGDEFLKTGKIVDSDQFIYRIDPSVQGKPGPGCWWDDAGRYHFVNANWLSQVLFSGANKIGGTLGLVVVQGLLIFGIWFFVAAIGRRFNAGLVGVAFAGLVVGIAAQARFVLRPEVCGLVVLSCELWLLSGLLDNRENVFNKKRMIGLVLAQLLLVNLHSYFMIGLLFTGAVWAEHLLVMIYHRNRKESSASQAIANFRKLSLVLALQIAVCFINPWTWRLAVLPIETLLFLRSENITSGELTASSHPWAFIGELWSPFTMSVAGTAAMAGYILALALAGAAAVVSVVKRRWAILMIILFLVMVSLSMRRNIALFIILTGPVSIGILKPMWKWFISRLSSDIGKWVSIAMMGILFVILSIAFAGIVTGDYYYRYRRPYRFGWDLCRVKLPIDAASWLSKNKPVGRIWTDYNSSSTIHYFTEYKPEMPLLTNTWACSPDVMGRSLKIITGNERFLGSYGLANKLKIQVVILRVDHMSDRVSRYVFPLLISLQRSPGWATVHVDARHVIFLRRSGENDSLIAEHEMTEDKLLVNLDEHISMLAGMDSKQAFPLYVGATTLVRIEWYRAAEGVCRAAVQRDDKYHEAWNCLGRVLAMQGASKQRAGIGQLIEAKKCFIRALEIKPDSVEANRNLGQVKRDIKKFR